MSINSFFCASSSCLPSSAVSSVPSAATVTQIKPSPIESSHCLPNSKTGYHSASSTPSSSSASPSSSRCKRASENDAVDSIEAASSTEAGTSEDETNDNNEEEDSEQDPEPDSSQVSHQYSEQSFDGAVESDQLLTTTASVKDSNLTLVDSQSVKKNDPPSTAHRCNTYTPRVSAPTLRLRTPCSLRVPHVSDQRLRGTEHRGVLTTVPPSYNDHHHDHHQRRSSVESTLRLKHSSFTGLTTDRSFTQQERLLHLHLNVPRGTNRFLEVHRAHHDQLRGASWKHIESVKAPTRSLTVNRLFSRSETLILFDWDDTLLPSSWLTGRQLTVDRFCTPTELEQVYLQTLSASVCSLLKAAVHCGRVVIVTNAESGWVDLSASKFMPEVVEALKFWHISVVSARSAFESPELQHPVQWKLHAFQHLLSMAYPTDKHRHHHQQHLDIFQHCRSHSYDTAQRTMIEPSLSPRHAKSTPPFPSGALDLETDVHRTVRCGGTGRKNVLSFGDSDSERIALIQCVTSMACREDARDGKFHTPLDPPCHHHLSLYKSFKLCENPSPSLLNRQLQLVQKLLVQLVHHGSNLDLRVNFKAVHH